MTAPSLVTISYTTCQNTYVYSPTKPGISHGLAIGFAMLAVLFGVVSMHVDQAAYNNASSTVMRASRSAELGVDIADEDKGGAKPLAKYIPKAAIRFCSAASSPEASGKRKTSADTVTKTPTASSVLLSSTDEVVTPPQPNESRGQVERRSTA